MEDMYNTIDFCVLVQQKQLISELTNEAYEQGHDKLGDYLDGVFRLLESIEDDARICSPELSKKPVRMLVIPAQESCPSSENPVSECEVLVYGCLYDRIEAPL